MWFYVGRMAAKAEAHSLATLFVSTAAAMAAFGASQYSMPASPLALPDSDDILRRMTTMTPSKTFDGAAATAAAAHATAASCNR